MSIPQHVISWFEIPASNYDRAKQFYKQILVLDLSDLPGPPGMKMAAFPGDESLGAIGGAIVEMAGYVPSATATTVYLNGGDNLQVVLDRVVLAGGKILSHKTDIGGGMGHFALFLDSEGNRVGLWSMG